MTSAEQTPRTENKDTKFVFWLSFDLGLKGDYSGLYSWLDSKKSTECGDSLALVSTQIPEDASKNPQEIVRVMRAEIEQHVKISSTDRMYIMFKSPDGGPPIGTFLFGKRKRSLWEGYSQTSATDTITDQG